MIGIIMKLGESLYKPLDKEIQKDLEKRKEQSIKDAKFKLKMFYIDVEESRVFLFSRKKVTYRQREVTLTDKEVEQMFNK